MVGLGDLLDRPREALYAVAHRAAAGVGMGSLGLVNGKFGDLDDWAGSGFDYAHLGDIDGHGSRLGGYLNTSVLGLRLMDIRNTLFWICIVAILLLIAFTTNPTEASFRSYLTELSFRRHLADIRSNDASAAGLNGHGYSNGHLSSPPSGPPPEETHDAKSDPHNRFHSQSGTSTPPIAPFRFANHVAISLRTPTLYRKTLLFFSLAITSPLGPPAFLSDPTPSIGGKKGNPNPAPRESVVLYLGYLGHWVQIGVVPRQVEWAWRVFVDSQRGKTKKKAQVERAGIIELKAVADKDDALPLSIKNAPTSSLNSKVVRKSGSINDLSDYLALPTHTTSPALNVSALPESRRTSIVNIIPPAPKISDLPDTTTLATLKADLSRAQDTLTDLRQQLTSHEQAVHDAHSSLQTNLDELRNKRKEDDAERQDLKSRTKSLEEQKRQAEAARREADKKLKNAEGIRDSVLAKIEAAKRDMSDTRSQIEGVEKAIRVLTEEGARFIVSTRESVEERKLELDKLEDELQGIDGLHDELGEKVKEAEDRLKATQDQVEAAAAAAVSAAASAASGVQGGKKIGPEEEMMMMAAAYEAAAQEGYQHHSPHGHSGPHHSPNSFANPLQPHSSHAPNAGSTQANWASQAAAYMAEAGMPYLDQNYTARPTHAGHYASRPPAQSDGKRLVNIPGYDDFGPAIPGLSGSPISGPGMLPVKRSSGDGFSQVLGQAAHRLSSTPPADDTSESEIYGDPGSPNGGISTSFSANLLGQGLFRSLVGGDVTPIDDEAGSTLEEALNFEPTPVTLTLSPDTEHGGNHDSGSESGDEHEVWRSPMSDVHMLNQNHDDHRLLPSRETAATTTGSGGVFTGPVQPPVDRAKRFSFSRLLPPTSTPPAAHGSLNQPTTTTPTLPGLPALPGSRRWFSGTGSTPTSSGDFALFHSTQSTDSLNHPPTLGIGGDSPFAPSEKEKKQLALGKWGPLSKYRWASGQPQSQADDDGEVLSRSASLDLNAAIQQNHARGISAPVVSNTGQGDSPGTSPGQSWMARHLHVNGFSSRSASSPSSGLGVNSGVVPVAGTGSGSLGLPIPSIAKPRTSSDLMEDDELEYHALVRSHSSPYSQQGQLGASPSSDLSGNSPSGKDKKGFKFFMRRKPSESNFVGGSSPGAS